MYDHTKDRMQTIQTAVETGRKRLEAIKAQLTDTPDPYLTTQLQRAGYSLDDVKMFFRMLEEQRMPPRSAAEEARILDHAQFAVEGIALPQVKAIEDLILVPGSARPSWSAQKVTQRSPSVHCRFQASDAHLAQVPPRNLASTRRTEFIRYFRTQLQKERN